jgi:hypothetical protein
VRNPTDGGRGRVHPTGFAFFLGQHQQALGAIAIMRPRIAVSAGAAAGAGDDVADAITTGTKAPAASRCTPIAVASSLPSNQSATIFVK